MNPTDYPPNSIDESLMAYFQAQVPKPWPAAPQLAQVHAAVVFGKRDRTRYTLAASVAFLFALGMWLNTGASRPADQKSSGLLEKGSANGNEIQKFLNRPASTNR
jgi:hypothetical protein